MNENGTLSVRDMTKEDTEHFVQYWLTSSGEHLTGMGVDIKKKPTRAQLEKLVFDQLEQTYQQKLLSPARRGELIFLPG